MNWLILIPSYNTGPDLLRRTVLGALQHCPDVRVVIDGSQDGSAEAMQALCQLHEGLRYDLLPVNQGKGAAVLYGTQRAVADGFTHVLTMDADGQHPAKSIPDYVKTAREQPKAALFGQPIFGPEAPAVRVQGRKISNAFVWLETLGWGVGDCLFGMRMYPCAELLAAFASTRFARRFDFDAEIGVRLAWLGVPMLSVPTPVRYLTQEEGGVSQFRYGRDNVLLTWMHARLLVGALLRFPRLLARKLLTKPCR
jgi:glycosyltransferase involved in cell wall biosynthesis